MESAPTGRPYNARMTAAPKTLHLVDASLFVFRAWHSMPDQWHDADGWPVNAVHGFARFLLELLELLDRHSEPFEPRRRRGAAARREVVPHSARKSIRAM